MKQRTVHGLLCGAALVLSGCAVGPNYHRPPITPAVNFKEQEGWKPSEPSDALDRGPWWEIFRDDALSQLETRIDISNQNVKAAAAAYEESRALLSQARAGFWPTISASGSRVRTVQGNSRPQTLNTLGASATWDIDIWGSIRRASESSHASEQASAAALAGARLSAQVQLATTYFELRGQDQLQNILDDIVAAQEASLKITQNRYRVGVAAKADVVTAQAQLLSSQAQQINAGIQRGVLEHAIAVLIGQQPANFSQAKVAMRSDVPTVPVGLPSALLERRPDIAEAERRVAAANAQIGVEMAAFFPSLTLNGSIDYQGDRLSKLIRTSNRVWSFGPELALSVFDGGLRRAQVAQARALHEASVANYRQTVLAGFQQVEDNLVTLRVLEQQSGIEDQAVAAAREAEKLTLNQYKAGTVPYSSVISAQTTRLNAEQTALNVFIQRLTTSIDLIEALGGGWKATDLK